MILSHVLLEAAAGDQLHVSATDLARPGRSVRIAGCGG
jgi:hypothetical protein